MSDHEAVNPDGGVSWKGRKATRMVVSAREIKLLRPICRTCADAVGGKVFLQPGWWNDCTHDPYISYRSVQRKRPIYEEVRDDRGNPTGTKKIVGEETFEEMEATPNWAQVAQDKGKDYGRKVNQALARGFIYPQQLRSPVWPNGIKRRCQFRDCFAEDVKKYNSGWFCRPLEAKLVRANDKSIILEIGGFSRDSDEKRQKQLDDIQVAI